MSHKLTSTAVPWTIARVPTPQVDAMNFFFQGIRFRGLTIPECQKRLPKAKVHIYPWFYAWLNAS